MNGGDFQMLVFSLTTGLWTISKTMVSVAYVVSNSKDAYNSLVELKKYTELQKARLGRKTLSRKILLLIFMIISIVALFVR